ncbi:hypothetical protein [Streptomyces sp. NPDC058657]|uniref:hypothetical protein n=1 Tax=unclassified Streptomyces TaxID=2593676 RepID=UPI00365748C2
MTSHFGSAAVAAVTATLLLGAAAEAGAAEQPTPRPDRAAAEKAATAPATLDTLARFFARDGALARGAAAPQVRAGAVEVNTLSPAFVAGRPGAPVAQLEFMASTAVAADGRKASLWTAPLQGTWQVVNIATGDDETRYAADGVRKLPGGTVFREPQIDAWYVADARRVLPLDEDATRAVGARGTTLAAYGQRVRAAYADKLPGSAYAEQGKAGGYAQQPQGTAAQAPATGTAAQAPAPGTAAEAPPTRTATAHGAPLAAVGGAALLALAGFAVVRLRRREQP